MKERLTSNQKECVHNLIGKFSLWAIQPKKISAKKHQEKAGENELHLGVVVLPLGFTVLPLLSLSLKPFWIWFRLPLVASLQFQ